MPFLAEDILDDDELEVYNSNKEGTLKQKASSAKESPAKPKVESPVETPRKAKITRPNHKESADKPAASSASNEYQERPKDKKAEASSGSVQIVRKEKDEPQKQAAEHKSRDSRKSKGVERSAGGAAERTERQASRSEEPPSERSDFFARQTKGFYSDSRGSDFNTSAPKEEQAKAESETAQDDIYQPPKNHSEKPEKGKSGRSRVDKKFFRNIVTRNANVNERREKRMSSQRLDGFDESPRGYNQKPSGGYGKPNSPNKRGGFEKC